MMRAGFWFMLFGVLGIVLPRIGMDHLVFALLGAWRPVAIWGCIAVGAVLMVAGFARRKAQAAAAANAPEAAAPSESRVGGDRDGSVR